MDYYLFLVFQKYSSNLQINLKEKWRKFERIGHAHCMLIDLPSPGATVLVRLGQGNLTKVMVTVVAELARWQLSLLVRTRLVWQLCAGRVVGAGGGGRADAVAGGRIWCSLVYVNCECVYSWFITDVTRFDTSISTDVV